MKTRHFLILLALVVAVAFVVGCSTSSATSTPTPDYVGTWSQVDGFGSSTGTLTMTFAATTAHWAISGGSYAGGTADFSMVVDESAKHMTWTCTVAPTG